MSYLGFSRSCLLRSWKTGGWEVGRFVGVELGLCGYHPANLWCYLARPPGPAIAQSSEMLSWSSDYRPSYRSDRILLLFIFHFEDADYSSNLPIQGLCPLIHHQDQRCHPDPPAIKPHIVPPHNAAPQNSTQLAFYSKFRLKCFHFISSSFSLRLIVLIWQLLHLVPLTTSSFKSFFPHHFTKSISTVIVPLPL